MYKGEEKIGRFFPSPISCTKNTLQIVDASYLEQQMLEYVAILTFVTAIVELVETCLKLYLELGPHNKRGSQQSNEEEQERMRRNKSAPRSPK